MAFHFPSLLSPSMVRGKDGSDRKRKRSWQPTIGEIMQPCIILVQVCYDAVSAVFSVLNSLQGVVEQSYKLIVYLTKRR